jgi:hypothetical protein
VAYFLAVRQQLALDRPPRRIELHAVRRRVPAGKQQQDKQQKTPRPEISHAQLLPQPAANRLYHFLPCASLISHPTAILWIIRFSRACLAA